VRGWHTNAAQRVLRLQLEGRTRRTVDLVAEKGRNVPAVFAFDASDENGDGWIDVAVAAAANSADKMRSSTCSDFSRRRRARGT